MPGDDAADFLAKADSLRAQGYFLAGWFAYEFGYLLEPRLHDFISARENSQNRPLAMLGVYNEPLVYNHKSSRFSGGQSWPTAGVVQDFFSCTQLQPTVSRDKYLQTLQQIQNYISSGDTYQVNFTLHLEFGFNGSVAALYRALRRNQSVSYGAWIRHDGRDILSFSPELFFTADSEGIRVRPMKGTLARGRTTAEDEQRKQQLGSDVKNRSENVMIVDLLRNDLGRLLHTAGGGTVIPCSLFDIETYESLLQMTSTVEAVPARDTRFSLKQLMTALFPCGSVTGAPKIRTMEIIHELEQHERGVYCGAIGFAGPAKSCFNVPIRTLELSGGRGKMGIGSGVVADSDPESEWRESLLKGNFLSHIKPDFQLIETLLLQPGNGFFLLEFHLERLADSARYFHFMVDIDAVRLRLQEEMVGCRKNTRVRLLLYRDGRIEITSVEITDELSPTCPGVVLFSHRQVDTDNPHLFHKTTRRNLYESERKLVAGRGYLDVLFTNTLGQVTEGAISNIFIRRKNRLLTPPVDCGLLAGTYRRFLLQKDRAVEQVLTVTDIYNADDVYVANSVRGLVQVKVEETMSSI
jgi:para-aminobenzoate synthetase/4-amino-4-deoxychorismate lyase